MVSLSWYLSPLSLIAFSATALAADAVSTNCGVDSNPEGAIYCTDRPVIGVYTEPSNEDVKIPNNQHFIAASYVKWLESLGARTVPIPTTVNNETIDSIFPQINGLLLPGGAGISLPDSLHRLWELAIAENESGGYFPVWGTCLGFERLISIASQEGLSIIQGGYDATFFSIALDLKEPGTGSLSSALFLNPDINQIVAKKPVTLNDHKYGIHPSTFMANEHLNSMFRILSTNKDRKGEEFVSTIEGRQYPIFGVQWHPEKNNFEFGSHGKDVPNQAINHSVDAVEISLAMASVFVRAARKNGHVYTGKYPLVWDSKLQKAEFFEQIFLIDVDKWNREYGNERKHEKPQLRQNR